MLSSDELNSDLKVNLNGYIYSGKCHLIQIRILFKMLLSCENMLVSLKYPDPFIEYAIFESCLSCCILVWAQNFSTMQWIVNFHTSPYSSNGLS